MAATAASYSPPHSANVLGAVTFTLYVLYALVLTTYVSISLLRTYNNNTGSHSSVQRARIQFFATLATISFATLSYHMLRFLVESYRAWAQQPHRHIPLPPQGASGLGGTMVGAWRRVDIWQWLKSSALFDHFAHEALGSQARSWWTVNALCASINWAVTMSIEGKKHKIPRRWAYTAIAQILPVSFAQNLFYVAILLSAPSPSSPSSPPPKSSEKSPPSENPPSSTRTPTSSNTKLETIGQMAPFLLYHVLVALAPSVATSQKYGRLLLPLVGAIRVLLIAPLFFPPEPPTPSSSLVANTVKISSAVLFAYQTLAALRENGADLVAGVLEGVRDYPAVAALGWDWLFSVGSFGAWACMDGR